MRRCTTINNEEESIDKPAVLKLMIDEPSDFRFHAAYEAYSKIWNLNPPNEVKKELNAMISLLSAKKLSYEDFYFKIDKYRKERARGGRRRIQTQRKRDWRKKLARKKRDSRYKKRRTTSSN